MPNFSDRYIQALKPKATEYTVRERGGFAVRVYPSGRKVFYMLTERGGRAVRNRIGAYPAVGLAEARRIASELLLSLERTGIPLQTGTTEELFAAYVDSLKASGKKSWGQAGYYLGQCLPALPGLAREITPRQVAFALKSYLDRDSEVSANRARSYLHAAFRWGMLHDNDPRRIGSRVVFGIEANPVASVPVPGKEAQGERVLTPDEFRALMRWDAPLAGKAAQLTIALGGQRVIETCTIRWADIHDGLLTFHHSNVKTGRFHVVPVGIHARRILDGIPEAGDWVLGLDGPMHFQSVNKAIRRLCEREGLERFTARDLRRTVKTMMGQAGIPKDIRDRLQNHAMTDVSSKHYDRYDYLAEKRSAIEAWDGFITSMLGNPPGRIR